MWIQNEANSDWHYKIGVVTVATLVKGTGDDPDWVILDKQENLTELFYGHDIGYLPGFKNLDSAKEHIEEHFHKWVLEYISQFSPKGWRTQIVAYAPHYFTATKAVNAL